MEIGLIGLGDMGKSYAKEFAKKGFNVSGYDLPEKRSQLEEELEGTGIKLFDKPSHVARISDYLIYAVEAENIEHVILESIDSIKKGAIVGGETSVKTPEILALEKYAPSDVNIVSSHSLRAPSVNPVGQTLVTIRHRSTDEAYKRALTTLEALGSNIVEIPDYMEHDRITADTQSGTHLAFQSIGTAWQNAGVFPWENKGYDGGIDNIKVLLALRIYGGKSHVFGGLALLNPYARKQVNQYAKSESELFKMMIQEDKTRFMQRMNRAADFVFGKGDKPILLDDATMGEFSLGIQSEETKVNSHLSQLTMVDAWYQMGINPYKHNKLCGTPQFRLSLGITEYLFRNPNLLEETYHTAIHNKEIRGDDLEFHSAVREWASIIGHGDMDGYKQKFDTTKDFFKGMLSDAKEKSDFLIEKLSYE